MSKRCANLLQYAGVYCGDAIFIWRFIWIVFCANWSCVCCCDIRLYHGFDIVFAAKSIGVCGGAIGCFLNCRLGHNFIFGYARHGEFMEHISRIFFNYRRGWIYGSTSGFDSDRSLSHDSGNGIFANYVLWLYDLRRSRVYSCKIL